MDLQALLLLLSCMVTAMQVQLLLLTPIEDDSQQLIMTLIEYAVVSSTAFVASSPSLLRSMSGIPRMARRLWSQRYDAETRTEVSKGVWENYIMDRAVSLSLRGFQDLSDKYYMILFRMPKAAFEYLYTAYGYRMAKKDTNRRKSIPGRKRMAIFLTYLAHGHKQEQLQVLYDVSQAVISRIIGEGLQVFLQFMVPVEITVPVGQQLVGVAQGFRSLAGMEGCIGAVDGTFFHIQQPSMWGEAYWCYKHIYAVLLLAVVDANKLFRWIQVGDQGSIGDAACWNDSDYKRMLLHGDFDLPQPLMINGVSVQSYVVADTTFAFSDRVMKCVEPAQLLSEKAFNAVVIRTRRIVENAYGFLKGRWNICVFNRISDPDEARDVAMVCCALHNFCQKHSLHYDPAWSGKFNSIEHDSAQDLSAYRAARRRCNRATGPAAEDNDAENGDPVRIALSQQALAKAPRDWYATAGARRRRS